jgi:hypothetical protein
MTQSTVVSTNVPDSHEAGTSLGLQIARALAGEPPDAVILLASTRYRFPPLLEALSAACRPAILVGGSSGGEFTHRANGEGMACAVALRAPPTELRFTATIGRSVQTDYVDAVRRLVSGFHGRHSHDYAFRSALVLTDWLAGHSEGLVERLTLETAGSYQFFGGGVGGDYQFAGRHVFFGTEAIPNAVVALEILSNKPLGVGVCHGWQPASAPMRVTEVDGSRLFSLNAVAAGDIYREHAEATEQRFDAAAPLPFFLHNVLGVSTSKGHKLRVPLALNPDQSIDCASEIPSGTTASIMRTCVSSSSDAAAIATRAAMQQLAGAEPQVALVLDCVATRLRLGKEFEREVDSVREVLAPVAFAGFNSIGQIARAEGQFSGFHNCTAVVCVFPT